MSLSAGRHRDDHRRPASGTDHPRDVRGFRGEDAHRGCRVFHLQTDIRRRSPFTITRPQGWDTGSAAGRHCNMALTRLGPDLTACGCDDIKPEALLESSLSFFPPLLSFARSHRPPFATLSRVFSRFLALSLYRPRKMRTLEPSLPSIASVLAFSQSQPELRSPSRRPPPRRLRRKASHPTGTHTPRCPPQLDSDHLMPDIFEDDEFEIVKSSDEGSSASSTACSARPSRSPAKARAKAKAVCSHILDLVDAVRWRLRCARPVRRAEDMIHFDLCN
ncbi:hypothetical protein EVG20_g5095 [Dentipellis fragilis]|uniref:Uncharacterized protein n=1 Tax=Dentipellis fragilis TaxID=205917 RepID=A0A4Y9YWM5_9AGAM|nr:hypothetical protein EVG20_g5095 [Dentipellis fragilis]